MTHQPSISLFAPTHFDRILNVAQWVARVIVAVLWLWLLTMAIKYHDLGIIALLAWFTYLMWPDLKHPCDYGSYAAWWADRANWRRP